MENKKQKYILVTGGELRNKGAQAMSFITVDQMARRYPECKVVLFSGADCCREEKEKRNYKFEIIPFPGFGEGLSLCTGLLKKRYLKRENGKYFQQYKSIFDNAVMMLDISGYALGSKWNASTNRGYLRRIRLAKAFNIPVFLMPQSFGPFDFNERKTSNIHSKIKKVLSKVDLIMAREKEGLSLLQTKYKLKNVIKTPDLVLQNKEINVENIYVNFPKLEEMDIPLGSVAVIPNSKNNKFGEEENNLILYQECIHSLLERDKKVFLIYHALEDLAICKKIKDLYFINEQRVVVIEEELSCIAFDNIVGKFDFIIGSRYHSIVHAYRKVVPVIILGWAVKYRELAEEFNQAQYCFDSSNVTCFHNDILNKVALMCDRHLIESKIIETKVADIQKDSVFDLIKVKV